MVAERRRLAFAGFRFRPLDAFDWVMGDGVPAAQIFEQRGQRREPVPDRAAAKPAPHELVAPGDDVRARDGAKFLRPDDAGEAYEILHRVLVGAPCLRIAQIGEPLDLGRHVGQPVELVGGQKPGNTGGGDRELVLDHWTLPHTVPSSSIFTASAAARSSRSRVASGKLRRCASSK